MWTKQLMDILYIGGIYYTLVDFNLAFASKTANPPNLIPRQHFETTYETEFLAYLSVTLGGGRMTHMDVSMPHAAVLYELA